MHQVTHQLRNAGGGDHVILAGGVETVSVADRMPLTYAARTFPRLLFDTSTPTR